MARKPPAALIARWRAQALDLVRAGHTTPAAWAFLKQWGVKPESGGA